MDAVDKKVLVCAGICYKGLRGQRKSLLPSWARVEQAAILESGSRCPVAPPSVRALKPLAFGARLEGRESVPHLLHICSKTPAKVYRAGKHWSTPQIQKVPSVESPPPQPPWEMKTRNDNRTHSQTLENAKHSAEKNSLLYFTLAERKFCPRASICPSATEQSAELVCTEIHRLNMVLQVTM